MTVKERPSFDDAIAITLDAIRVAQQDGAQTPLILGIIKSKMHDEGFLDKKSRQTFLRDLNLELKTSYTMSQVRKSDATLLHQAKGTTGHKEPSMIPVDELHGSVDVPAKGVKAHAVPDSQMPPADSSSNAEIIIDRAALDNRDDIDVVLEEDALKASILNPSITQSLETADAELHAMVQELFKEGFGVQSPDERVALYDQWTATQAPELVEGLDAIRKQLRNSTPDNQFFTFLRGLDKALWEDFKGLVLNKGEAPQPEPAQPTDAPAAAEPVSEPALEHPAMTTSMSNAKLALMQLQAEDPADVSLPPRADTSVPGNTTSTTTDNATSDDKATTMKNDSAETFIAGLAVFGYNTEEARAKLFEEFLSIHPQFRMAMNAQPSSIGQSGRFFAAATLNKEMEDTFALWMIAKHPEVAAKWAQEVPGVATAEEKSRYSIMGPKGQGVRSGWVGAAAALIGGALEMGTAGSISVGSGVGTVLGSVGAFFLAEQTDKMIEGQFGRQVAAGTMGLALGALGSKAGRYTEGAVFGSGQSMEAPTAVQIPTLGSLLPSTASAESFGITNLYGM